MTERAYRGRSYTLLLGTDCDISLRINTQSAALENIRGDPRFLLDRLA